MPLPMAAALKRAANDAVPAKQPGRGIAAAVKARKGVKDLLDDPKLPGEIDLHRWYPDKPPRAVPNALEEFGRRRMLRAGTDAARNPHPSLGPRPATTLPSDERGPFSTEKRHFSEVPYQPPHIQHASMPMLPALPVLQAQTPAATIPVHRRHAPTSSASASVLPPKSSWPSASKAPALPRPISTPGLLGMVGMSTPGPPNAGERSSLTAGGSGCDPKKSPAGSMSGSGTKEGSGSHSTAVSYASILDSVETSSRLAQWLTHFAADEQTFASKAVFVEMRLRQALATSVKLGMPNVFRIAIVCDAFERVAPMTGRRVCSGRPLLDPHRPLASHRGIFPPLSSLPLTPPSWLRARHTGTKASLASSGARSAARSSSTTRQMSMAPAPRDSQRRRPGFWRPSGCDCSTKSSAIRWERSWPRARRTPTPPKVAPICSPRRPTDSTVSSRHDDPPVTTPFSLHHPTAAMHNGARTCAHVRMIVRARAVASARNACLGLAAGSALTLLGRSLCARLRSARLPRRHVGDRHPQGTHRGAGGPPGRGKC